MKPEPSHSAALLVGNRFPDDPRRIVSVMKQGDARTVTYENGEHETLTAASLGERVAVFLKQQYRLKSLRSARTLPDGKVVGTIGGPAQGTRKVYSNSASFRGAVTRYYGPKI